MSQLFGDWKKFRHVLTKLSENADQYQGLVISMSDKIVERLWDIIESQSIDMAPLNENYLTWKTNKGLDERTAIKTGDYLNSLSVLDIQSDGDSLTVQIGVEDSTREDGISMREVAYYLEYGTHDQPARMPLHKSWEEMKRDVMNEVNSRLKAEIRSNIT